MSETDIAKGSCLCDAVKITVKNMTNSAGACHCKMCQKWAGGPFMTVDCGSAVDIAGAEHISVYHSSDWGERAFCTACGSHLYYRLKEANQFFIPVGLFDTEMPFEFDHQIFIESKPAYFQFANETKNMTGAEVFAQYAPGEE